jgi:hypothetical protein
VGILKAKARVYRRGIDILRRKIDGENIAEVLSASVFDRPEF